jgi:REP element-mobilizing transposase RayT
MIAASHLIWTAYGWWLPNDPRGSSSQSIRAASIADLGELHQGRKRVQPAGEVIREFYEAAAGRLKFTLLNFSDEETEAIGESFQEVVTRYEYTCFACALMPDHVHLLIRKHRDKPEEMIAAFQEASRSAVRRIRATDHPVWGGPGWKVYLETSDDVRRTIRYVEENPVKIGRPRQRWPFVKAYDGWLPAPIRRKPL